MTKLNIYNLPDVLFSKLHTTTVYMSENNGIISIKPIMQKKQSSKLRGMFSDGKLSVEKHLKMMQKDKEAFEQ